MSSLQGFCDFLSEIWQIGVAIINLESFDFKCVSRKMAEQFFIEWHVDLLPSEFVKEAGELIHPKDMELFEQIRVSAMEYYNMDLLDFELAPITTYNIRIRDRSGYYQHISVSIKLIPGYYVGFPDERLGMMMCAPEVKWGFERFSICFPDKKILFYSKKLERYVNRANLDFRDIEKNILQLTAMGNSENKIAKELHVKIDLIRYYKKNIFQKLHASNMMEAVYIAGQMNLLENK